MAVRVARYNAPSLLWGVHEPKPLAMFPAGRARIRMRDHGWVVVYIKTATGIRGFYPRPRGSYWLCDYTMEFGWNERI